MNIKKNILAVIFLTISVLSFAQQFRVEAKIDSTVMYIGQQCNISFDVWQKPGLQVAMPMLKDSITKGVEIINVKTDTIFAEEGTFTVRRNYLVTIFDSALYYIPEFTFVANGDTVMSNPLSVKVLTVPIDTTQQEIPIADIKPILDAPFDWETLRKVLIVVLVVLILLGVGAWLVMRYIRNKKQPVAESQEPESLKTPTEIALEKLEEIRQNKIWQQGRVKEYYSDITDVLREYIEQQFNIVTFERTSSEIIDGLLFVKNDYSQQLILLKKIFTTSDMVKFAKMIPDFDEHNNILNEAVNFVDETAESIKAEIVDENIK